MRVGIATDHGGFGLKEDLAARLRAAGHEVVDFGAYRLVPGDDYPDFVIPLGRAVSAGEVERGIAVCGSGVGASVCANKIPGRSRRPDWRSFFGAAGRRRRPYERDLHGWADGRTGSGMGSCPDLSGIRIQPGRAPPAAAGQSGCTRGGNEDDTSTPKPSRTDLDQLCINTIRTLSMDAVQQANSGHPGTPMALAPLVYTIWNRVMRFDPQDPIWPNRDRFVLSNGHASMLLWSVLHLTRTQAVNAEYEKLGQPSVTLDDIRHFRQLDSKAPGHPEYHWVSGVETTTGPLGQGIATSVGMAIAQKWLARSLQPPRLQDFRLQHLCRLRRWLHDGRHCFGSGFARRPPRSRQSLLDLRQQPHHHRRQHAASPSRKMSRRVSWLTAGTSCGSATPTTSTASSTRSKVFRKTTGRPTFIVLDSHIGYGSPHKQDTAEAHGEPLGEEEIRLTKRAYGWPEDAKFLVPDGVYEHFEAGIGARGRDARSEWTKLFDAYRATVSRTSPPKSTRCSGANCRPAGIAICRYFPRTRRASPGATLRARCLNVLAQNIPWFLGGSADLGPSNKTAAHLSKAPDTFRPTSPAARTCTSASASTPWRAIVNGLSLSKLRAFGATFFIFSDYARPGHPALGPDGAADDFRLHPRRDGRRRRRPNPSAGGASRVPARHPRPGHSAARAMPTKSSRLIATSCSCAISRPCWCSRASRCPLSTGPNTRPRPASRVAPMCSPTRPAASPR